MSILPVTTPNEKLLSTEVTSDSLSEPDLIECGYPNKNPTVALFLSVLPGGGQFYTENYLKGVVIGGVQIYVGGGTIYLHLKAEEAKRKKYESWEYYYEWYSNQRNNFLWWDALVWALSMADAYVSAHFYKFKEQGNLKIDTGFRSEGLRWSLQTPSEMLNFPHLAGSGRAGYAVLLSLTKSF